MPFRHPSDAGAYGARVSDMSRTGPRQAANSKSPTRSDDTGGHLRLDVVDPAAGAAEGLPGHSSRGASHPDAALLSGQEVATYDVYAEAAAGPWAPERQQVHHDILDGLDSLDPAPATP